VDGVWYVYDGVWANGRVFYGEDEVAKERSRVELGAEAGSLERSWELGIAWVCS
jgi:hypothetical protein